MIKRRDFLKTCAVAGGLQLAGCGSGPEKPVAAPAGAANDAGAATGQAKAAPPRQKRTQGDVGSIEMEFRGLCLFAIPSSDGRPVDVILPKTESVEGLERHFGTLRIPRWAVHESSDAIPAAADEDHVYFSLAGKTLEIIPRSSVDARQWRDEQSNLQVGRDDIDSREAVCNDITNWDSMLWLIDLSQELWDQATLDPNWRSSSALFGSIHLTHGSLEYDQGTDNEQRFSYELTHGNRTSRRVIKEKTRYNLSANYIQFKLGNKSCLVNTAALRSKDDEPMPIPVRFDHVPAHWMPPEGRMTDFWAFARFMKNVPSNVRLLNVPQGRQLCVGTTGKSTGGCKCCPGARVAVS